jgi:hypothetical protein
VVSQIKTEFKVQLGTAGSCTLDTSYISRRTSIYLWRGEGGGISQSEGESIESSFRVTFHIIFELLCSAVKLKIKFSLCLIN